MSKTLNFELQDEIYEVLQQMATKSGRPIEHVALEWLVRHIPKQRTWASPEEAEAARLKFRSYFGSVSSGDPRSADNDKIDADLMEEAHMRRLDVDRHQTMRNG